MIDADKLLKEGAARRERAENRRKLLAELRRGTQRSKWTAIACLPSAGFYFWRLATEFMLDAPMAKGDAIFLLTYGLVCAMMLYLSVDALRINRRDLFLIELLEEREGMER